MDRATITPTDLRLALAEVLHTECEAFEEAKRAEALYQAAKSEWDRLNALRDDDLRREIVACDHCGHKFFPLPCPDCPDPHCPKCGEPQPSTAKTTVPQEVAL